MTPDSELLREYAEHGSQPAFTELVHRHVDMVYSVAARLVGGDCHLAEDVAQTVFTTLALRAGSLARHPTLVGWLHTTAHFAATNAIRKEQRRRAREQEAFAMSQNPTSAEISWEQLRPVLDDAINHLRQHDRVVVLLRFFQNKSHREVGEILGLSEGTARKRSDRALEKLRAHFGRRGVAVSAAALAETMGANSIQAAPAGFAGRIAAGSFAGAGGGVALLKTLYMTTKTKTILAAAIVLILAVLFSARPFWQTAPPMAASAAPSTKRALANAGSGAVSSAPESQAEPAAPPAGELPQPITGVKTEISPGVAQYTFDLNRKKFSFYLLRGDQAVPLNYDDLRRDPVFLQQLATNIRRSVERDLADLAGQFGLSAEQADHLIDIEAARKAQAALLDIQYSSSGGDAAEERARSQEFQAINDEAAAKIREILPQAGDAGAYQNYLSQSSERSDVRNLQRNLANAGVALSPEQSEALVGIIAQAEQDAKLPNSVQQAVLSLAGGDNRPGRLQLVDARQAILENSAAILSPTQRNVLAENEEAFLESRRRDQMTYTRSLLMGSTQSGDGVIIGAGGGDQHLEIVKSPDGISINSTVTTEAGTAAINMSSSSQGTSFNYQPPVPGFIPGSGGGGGGASSFHSVPSSVLPANAPADASTPSAQP